MQNSLRKCLLFWLGLLTLFGTSAYGQNTKEVPLASLLSTLETRFEVRFSYSYEIAKDYTIEPPSKSLSLEETLHYLAEKTGLQFTEVSERYISITVTDASFCGTLLDASTGQPLTGATIQAKDSYAVSDKNGVFTLAVGDETELTIQFLGYQPLAISTAKLNTSCPNLYLSPSLEPLDAVVLSPVFVNGLNISSNGGIIINTEHFGLLPGQVENDVLQIAQALPGVESIDETISNINIRGGSNDENLLLWDGIKMYQSGHFFGLISAFNPALTKQVVLYKNGSPAHYGEGVSSVIDMRSKNTVSKKFSGGFGLNLIAANGYVDVPISDNNSFQFSVRHAVNPLFETPVYSSYTQRIFQDTEITGLDETETNTSLSTDEDFSFYDVSAKWLYDPSDKDNIRLNFWTANNRLDITETIDNSNTSENSRLEQRSLVGGLSWQRDWSETFSTKAQAYGTYYLLDALNRDIFTTQEQIQDNEVLETGIKADTYWQLNELFKLETGYHFYETGITNIQDVNLPRFRNRTKEVMRTHVGHTALTYFSENGNTEITAGVRANHFSKFSEVVVEPRLQLYQKLSKSFSILALGEFKSQTTTQRIDFQSDFLGIEKRRWTLANPDNRPIVKSKQASVGFQYKQHNWLVNVEGFFKEVEDITASNQGFQNQFQFSRAIGSYTASGAEFTLNKKGRNYSIWGTYLFMNNDYTFPSLTPSEFPSNRDVRHTATVAGSFQPNEGWNFSAGISYRTGKPFTIPLEENSIVVQNGIPSIQYQEPNAERLDPYFRADLSAEYSWRFSETIQGKANVAVLNVFNTTNVLNTRYAILENTDGTLSVSQIRERSLGLTPNASLQILF
ncbi:TonB-dependent receptor plug domain-containing protein [Luteirhabdus pelagi]|uniref:TonB-dependent receptor plug domain-containing protein n=1 Tax=Luteirhabdus pelagi TaxID=2792783 RepID=UPI001939695E|nr:carboxypeptidase-like regulatory domain-containing protein [Luteirhabdus pelagi]